LWPVRRAGGLREETDMEIEVRSAQGSYTIFVAEGLLLEAAERIAPLFSEAAVVCDENTCGLFGVNLVRQLKKRGVRASMITVPQGEASKGQDTLFYLYHALIGAGLTRSGGIIALGGGVVGDLAGFAAATLYRGVGLLQIPTTLLAQVDSSVGGKTAIDLPEGKNLVGAFYQPRMVLIDPKSLDSLPKRQLLCGMAEVVKYALIRDSGLYQRLCAYNGRSIRPHLGEIAGRCCEIKREYVQQDTFDRGARMQLNFGHTLGHAIELSVEGILHGEAVAMGMVAAAGWSEALGVCPSGTRERTEAILAQYGLPTEIKRAPAELMMQDKKGAGDSISVVLLRDIGDAFVQRMKKSELISLAREAGQLC
jgi:3-dehydroquinate synthase